tara:strand:- start:198 stop:317 length:120 start_codon:yes stop_codon:yes gene_type:complete
MLSPILDDEQYKQWKANEAPVAREKRQSEHATILVRKTW